MNDFITSLERRLYISQRHKERYQSDPEYRLRCVNRGRVWQGLEPRQSADEIRTRAAR